MPLERCQQGGRPGWRWGKAGKCYTYDPDVAGSEERARARALAQARAIQANRGDALALAREVRAAGWYLQQPSVQVGSSACSTCSPRADQASALLLRELRGDAKGRPPLQRQPLALEARYRGQLLRRVRATHQVLLQAMKSAIEPMRDRINARARADAGYTEALAELLLLAGTPHDDDAQLAVLTLDLELALQLQPGRRQDNAARDARRLIKVVDRVQAAVEKSSPVQLPLLLTLADQVRSFTTRSVTKQVLSVVGIDVLPQLGQASALLGKWAEDNAALITSIDARYFDEIRDAVVATVGEGHSTASLSRAISDRYGVARSRADLIATDQIGTLNAQITQERQTALGIEEYIWSDSDDSRVRPLHAQLDGTVRRWDTPHPTEGHPGMPIRCRCSALPVI